MQPLRAQIEVIVRSAQRAPSPENCQPWAFRWDGACLLIERTAARAEHVMDWDGSASLLALGMVLESIALSAGAFGFRAVCTLVEPQPDDGLWAEVRFHAGGACDDLYRELDFRCTDRRLYRGGAVDPVLQEDLRLSAHRLAWGDRSPELVDWCVRVDACAWTEPQLYRDILRWIRFSKAEVDERRDGIAWNNLGLPIPEIPGMNLMRAPQVRRIVERFRGHRATGLWLRRQLASSAAIGCLVASGVQSSHLLELGRAALQVWLRLQRAGFALQPLALQSLGLLQLQRRGLHPTLSATTGEVFTKGKEVTQRAYGLLANEVPVWMFRTGLAPVGGPPRERTLRLELAEVLDTHA